MKKQNRKAARPVEKQRTPIDAKEIDVAGNRFTQYVATANNLARQIAECRAVLGKLEAEFEAVREAYRNDKVAVFAPAVAVLES